MKRPMWEFTFGENAEMLVRNLHKLINSEAFFRVKLLHWTSLYQELHTFFIRHITSFRNWWWTEIEPD